MIGRLVATLARAGVSLDARELADVLWLATQLPAPAADGAPVVVTPPREPPSPGGAPPPVEVSAQAGSPRVDPTPHAFTPSTPPAACRETSPDASVATRGKGATDPGAGGVSIRAPGAAALPHQRELARALRPLKRRVSTARDRELDLGATVERCAESGLWIPVWRRARGRWLDLALVVDVGRSMDVWRRTAHELHRLLTHAGAFRRVTLWSLGTDAAGPVVLRAGLGGDSPRRSPREMASPDGRCAVLVVSDCVSPSWHQGAVTSMLRGWGATQPVAVLQVLPRPFWTRTALRHHYDTRVSARAPAAPNARLGSSEALAAGDLALPVVTLGPDALRSWAWVLTGREGAQSPGVVLEREFQAFEGDGGDAPEAPSGSARVASFRALASRAAWRLALTCSAAPVVTLPVLRILRQTLVPEADTRAMAEVMLSGLLREVADDDDAREPDAALYEFVDGAREALLADVPVATTLEVMERVSAYVSRAGGAAVDFGAVVRGEHPALQGDAPIGKVFARVAPSVLRAIGVEAPEGSARPALRDLWVMVVCATGPEQRAELLPLAEAFGRRLGEEGYPMVARGGSTHAERRAVEAFEAAAARTVRDVTCRLVTIPNDGGEPGRMRTNLEALAVADVLVLLTSPFSYVSPNIDDTDHLANLGHLARLAGVAVVAAPFWAQSNSADDLARTLGSDPELAAEIAAYTHWQQDPVGLVDLVLRRLEGHRLVDRRGLPPPMSFSDRTRRLARSVCAIVDREGAVRGTGFLLSGSVVLSSAEVLPQLRKGHGWTADFVVPLRERSVRLSFPLGGRDLCLALPPTGLRASQLLHTTRRTKAYALPLVLRSDAPDDPRTPGEPATVAWFSPKNARVVTHTGALQGGATADDVTLVGLGADDAMRGGPVLQSNGEVVGVVTGEGAGGTLSLWSVRQLAMSVARASGPVADHLRSILPRAVVEATPEEAPPPPPVEAPGAEEPSPHVAGFTVFVVCASDTRCRDALEPLARELGRHLARGRYKLSIRGVIGPDWSVVGAYGETLRSAGIDLSEMLLGAHSSLGVENTLTTEEVLDALLSADCVIVLNGPYTPLDPPPHQAGRLANVGKLAALVGIPVLVGPRWTEDSGGVAEALARDLGSDAEITREILALGVRWKDDPSPLVELFLQGIRRCPRVRREPLPPVADFSPLERELSRSVCAITDRAGAVLGTGFVIGQGDVVSCTDVPIPVDDPSERWTARFVIALKTRCVAISVRLDALRAQLRLDPPGVHLGRHRVDLATLGALVRSLPLDTGVVAASMGESTAAWFSPERGRVVTRTGALSGSPGLPDEDLRGLPQSPAIRGAPVVHPNGAAFAIITDTGRSGRWHMARLSRMAAWFPGNELPSWPRAANPAAPLPAESDDGSDDALPYERGTDARRDALCDALSTAFRTHQAFDFFVALRVRRDFVAASAELDHRARVAATVDQAVAGGWVDALLREAFADQPRSPELSRFYKRFFDSARRAASLRGVDLEQLAGVLGGVWNAHAWFDQLGTVVSRLCRFELGGADGDYGTGVLVGPDLVLTTSRALARSLRDQPGLDVVARFDLAPEMEGAVAAGLEHRLHADRAVAAQFRLPTAKASTYDCMLVRLARRAADDPTPSGTRGFIHYAPASPSATAHPTLVLAEYTRRGGIQVEIDEHSSWDAPAALAVMRLAKAAAQGVPEAACFTLQWQLVAMAYQRGRCVSLDAIRDALPTELRAELGWDT